MRTIQTLIRTLYPPRCLACGGLVESEFGLCASCWQDTPFISGLVCNSCGVPLPGDDPQESVLCDDCIASPPPWKYGRAAMEYAGTARRLALALKHGDRQDIARPAGGWLFQAAQPILTQDMLVAPVPLHWRRMLKRRYNQAALLAHSLCKKANLIYCPDLLCREKKTQPLEHKTYDERHSALQNAITVHKRHLEKIKNSHILLVDDVMTSGATLTDCTRACLEAGAKEVSVVVLARVVKAYR